MIYFNKKPIARVVRRDMHLVRIIDGGRTTYHYDPVRGRARTMPGVKLTAVDDGVVLRFNSDTDSFSGVGDWPLQWSRGREWCDVEWNRTTLTMAHAGDCIWLRPKLDFFVPTHRQYIQANGRCSIEGYAQLFNPTGHCFPSKQNVITGLWPKLWRGDWCGELRIEGDLWAWNIDDIGYCWIDGLGLITSVIIPDDTDTGWSFCNYESMVNLTAPKLKWVPEIQGCTSLTEVWLPSATKPLDPGVFNNCTNLERVILPSFEEPQSTLFEGLSALAYIRVGMTSWPSFPLVDWVSGVAANGTFIKHAALPEIYDEAHIPTGWTVLIDTPAVSVTGTDWDARRTVTLSTQLPNAAIRYTMDGTEPSATHGTLYTEPFAIDAATTIKAVAYDDYGPSDIKTQTIECRHALAITALTAASVQLTCTGAKANNPPSLEYSTNGGVTWAVLAANVSIPMANVGDKMYLRAGSGSANAFWLTANDRARFTLTGKVEMTGSVQSLIDPTWYQDGAPTITRADALHGVFEGCGAIEGRAPEMPALTGASRCYAAMFKNCTCITHAKLALTALTAYGECAAMFEGCAALCHIYVDFTEWNDTDYATDQWVHDVSLTGVFHCRGTLPEIHDETHIPTGWDVYGPGHEFQQTTMHGRWAEIAEDGIEVD